MKKIIFGAYTHAKPDGKVFYIGKGPRSRAYSPKRNNWHNKIVKKYGWENIRIKFYACSSEKAALKKEKILIKNYRQKGAEIVNFTDGGEGVSGLRHTAKSKRKMSKSKKLLLKDPQRRKQMSEITTKIFKERPEYKKRMVRSLKKFWKNHPEDKKIMSRKIRKIMKKFWDIPENKQKRILEYQKGRHKISKKIKAKWKDPNYRKRILRARKYMYKDPVRIAKIRKALYTPEHRKRVGILSKRNWLENREKMIVAIKKGMKNSLKNNKR